MYLRTCIHTYKLVHVIVQVIGKVSGITFSTGDERYEEN
jgi:hypothetical protein